MQCKRSLLLSLVDRILNLVDRCFAFRHTGDSLRETLKAVADGRQEEEAVEELVAIPI